MDNQKIKNGVELIIDGLGLSLEDEHLRGTPDRVARMYMTELCSGYSQKPEDILNIEFSGEYYDEMIVCRDIDFMSCCSHHLLPFRGRVVVGYIPDKKVTGLSKLGRLVDIYAKRLQVQERITVQIADALYSVLKPKGCGVVVFAQHQCMCGRGVRKENAEMVTVALRGMFLDRRDVKDEFLKMSKIY